MSPSIREVDTKFSPISLLKELARKSIHISACGVALFLVGKDFPVLEIAFLPIMALGFYVTEKVDVLGKTISFGNRRKWGGILLALGLSLVMLAPVDYEVKKFAILTLMIADVAAAIVGKIVPIREVEVLGAYKSIGGSIAFALGVLIALMLSFSSGGDITWWQIVTVVVALEVAEFLNWRGIDNLTIPIVAMVLATALLV